MKRFGQWMQFVVRWSLGIGTVVLWAAWFLSARHQVGFDTGRGPRILLNDGLAYLEYNKFPSMVNAQVFFVDWGQGNLFAAKGHWQNEPAYWVGVIPAWWLMLIAVVLFAVFCGKPFMAFWKRGLVGVPRTRRVLWWTGLAGSTVFAIAWILSLWGGVSYTTAGLRETGIAAGAVWSKDSVSGMQGWDAACDIGGPKTATAAVPSPAASPLNPFVPPPPTPTSSIAPGKKVEWLFEIHKKGKDWSVSVPLWIPAIGLGLIAGFAKFQERVAFRATGRCAKCGYELGGLDEGAGCPECGT